MMLGENWKYLLELGHEFSIAFIIICIIIAAALYYRHRRKKGR